MQYNTSNRGRGGFSLLELVVVIVIIGIISAIAIPRMSKGAKGASENASKANVAVLESAIELYTAEHGGTRPTAAAIADQLTKCSNDAGTVKSGTAADVVTPDATYAWGPYLKVLPPATYGAFKGKSEIATSATKDADTGWIYDEATGRVTMNE
ncbi:MAG TPA: prepilin-type N-terminal cleavage/methylation domain-containing protein [Tepidisphaeraceae bacterium]|jgi:prepilin-type N-terminal cleavage/methylation domain-containing protein|nr:prepilin-type N-terminal cleavage/methylation domain-containing protein [Tepidisphaeraceae bacterium]